jgi:hypothetical protein
MAIGIRKEQSGIGEWDGKETAATTCTNRFDWCYRVPVIEIGKRISTDVPRQATDYQV